MVERRIPNPMVVGSSPSWPATLNFFKRSKTLFLKEFIKYNSNQNGVSVNRVKNYYQNAKSELLKVIFPIKEQIRSAYLSVFIVVTVITLFLALIDGIMSLSLSSIIN
jgi:preprotein translocase subunit SecE